MHTAMAYDELTRGLHLNLVPNFGLLNIGPGTNDAISAYPYCLDSPTFVLAPTMHDLDYFLHQILLSARKCSECDYNAMVLDLLSPGCPRLTPPSALYFLAVLHTFPCVVTTAISFFRSQKTPSARPVHSYLPWPTLASLHLCPVWACASAGNTSRKKIGSGSFGESY